MSKPIQVKPNLYAVYFPPLKQIAFKYGYNLVIHGSMNRDMDLIAIPWADELRQHLEMITEMSEFVGGKIMINDDNRLFSDKPHGRICYVIDIYRGGYSCNGDETKYTYTEDPQYYLDISVTPSALNT